MHHASALCEPVFRKLPTALLLDAVARQCLVDLIARLLFLSQSPLWVSCSVFLPKTWMIITPAPPPPSCAGYNGRPDDACRQPAAPEIDSHTCLL